MKHKTDGALCRIEEAMKTEGCALIQAAIPRETADELCAEVHALVNEARETGDLFHEPYYHENSFKVVRALRRTSRLDSLIDNPSWFEPLISLMGCHIQLMDVECFVRGSSDVHITGFHTDLGPGMQQLVPAAGQLFLEIKAQLFLTDLPEPDSGNFAYIPGSHLELPVRSDSFCGIEALNREIGPDGSLPAAAKQIQCMAGDVLLFPHSLWHAVAPNRTGRTRFSISLRYGQLALRPLERFSPILANANRPLSPRQRRLLGDFGDDGASPYRPTNQEAIMRGL